MAIQTDEQKKIWNNFLLKYDKKLKNYVPVVSDNTNYSAVIMETREHHHLEVVIKNFMYFLNESNSDIKWGLYIFHSDDNKKFVENFTNDWKNVKLKNIGSNISNQNDYSTILTNSTFWNTIKSDNILIFQPDTILLRNGIDKFLGHSYVGAPWLKPKEGKLIGNGGLSFRKKQKMIEIINSHSTELIDNMYNEDIFFCKYLKENDVPSLELCKEFAVEDIYYKNPLGLHQPKIEPKKLKKILNELL